MIEREFENNRLTQEEEKQLGELLKKAGPRGLERIQWASRGLPQIVERETKLTAFDRFIEFWFRPIFTYPVILALFVTGSYSFYNWDRTKNLLENESFYAQGLKDYIQKNRSFFSFLSSTKLKVIPMVGSKDSHGQVTWDHKTGQIMVNFKDLPDAPPGRDYQLWLITNGKWHSVGLFREQTIFRVSTKDISHFALTLEAKEGSRTPKGERILFGAI